ncbi:Oidioi.mRNA.OKI2018_I69.PAR.g9763.t2.cds [Oikopleura dioica]|uniref:Oidioi.mRNA.OKI2018_I69.PAR.g9763.t2.cds n=1 Tax=Oikopleura dioica TaxID=34765 RepID=A0ABN7RM41_OIKDI|nr:Oidioi.mRNA.OKI2018_I69.PAR.g9763.t2.cds [Oikopleura dioica]
METISLDLLRKENLVENIKEEAQDKNNNSEDIIHHCQYRGEVNGRIIFTNYRLIFAAKGNSWFIVSVPYNTINKVSKSPHRTTNTKNLLNGSEQSPLVVEIECKDFRSLKFDFKHDNGDKSKFHNNVSQRAFGNIERLFCFVKKSETSENWFIYDVHKEFERQTKNLQSKGEWIITEENNNFGLCDTYPKYLVVPKMEKEKVTLQKVASYRSRNRLPVATWIHPTNGAVITRCSQPLVGVTERRCGEDYLYLKKIRDLRTPEANKLLIYDCRPKVNAQG